MNRFSGLALLPLLRLGGLLLAILASALLFSQAARADEAGGGGATPQKKEDVQGEATTKMKKENNAEESDRDADKEQADVPGELEIATLAGGCFWCTEAVMERLEGVVEVISGYMGGTVDNPTYKQVVQGTTGHAEAIQVKYDPEKITFDDLLEVFWQAHDPTTLNRQGADVGTQYRSAIFYHSEEQKRSAEASIRKLDASGIYESPAVTEITEASTFWEAEDYHQDYYRYNKDQNPYCRIVIAPKLKKLGLD